MKLAHSELTKRLHWVGDNYPSTRKVMADLIRDTSQGVAPEAGKLEAMEQGLEVTSFSKPTTEAFGAKEFEALVNAKAPAPKFRFGPSSNKELMGVKKELVTMAHRALDLTTQDFMVFDGLRTEAEQRVLVKRGASRTMLSRHRVQPDGFGHAIDLVPYVSGKPVWDWEPIYHIVLAVDMAATDMGIADRITWGGAWDRRLSDFGGSADAYREEVRLYTIRHPGKDFIDGPHFQWES